MGDDTIERTIDSAIVSWWDTLSKRIALIKEQGGYPVLIALSRKMPRLFNWLTTFYIPTHHPDLYIKEVLDGCELTTELSVPFHAIRKKFNIECFILLDDIVIHGTTLKTIATNLELLASVSERSTQFVCYISGIFIYRLPSVMPSCVSFDDIANTCTLSLQEALNVVEYLAGEIRNANLPLDMEFPMFRCELENCPDGYDVNMLYDYLTEFNLVATYKGAWNNTVTALLDQIDGFNVFDFAKLRAYFKKDEIVFESFSPCTLPDLLSSKLNLFTNTNYARIWDTLVSPLKQFSEENLKIFSGVNGESLRRCFGRSLAVLANYLLSLSFFVTKCVQLIPEVLKKHMVISQYDVMLIVGEELSETVTNSLRDIFTERIENPFIGLSFDDTIEDSFAPDEFVDKYSLYKAILASHSNCIQDVLYGIFKFQHFANPEYDKPQYRFERLFYGETYSSLVGSCSPYFTNKLVDINRWIDDQIDNGVVVPKYELCTAFNGNRYWRRFFHAGLNMTEESKLCYQENV